MFNLSPQSLATIDPEARLVYQEIKKFGNKGTLARCASGRTQQSCTCCQARAASLSLSFLHSPNVAHF